MSFVKSADTKTAVVNSKSEIEKMLRRYGADGFSVSHNYALGIALVSFIVPDSMEKNAAKIPVKIPVESQRIYHALYGMPTTNYVDGVWQSKAVHNPKGYNPKKMEQAERVAWRNLVLWVDAALSAATIGLQTITEAFFAHAVIGENGERAIELVIQGAPLSRRLNASSELSPPPQET